MRRSLLFIIFLIVVTAPVLEAQKRKTEKAYSSFKAGEYYDAIDLFKDAYSKTRKSDKNTRTDVVFMIGECYRLTNNPKDAETWYKLAVKSAYSKPEAQFWLAESIKKNGKSQMAIDEFKKYKQVAPSDPRADQEIRSCELALEWLRNPEAYKVEDLKDLNSKESDFSPAYGRDDFGLIYFTSSRDDATGTKTHGATGQSYTDIFESRLDKKSKWSTPVPVNGLNSDFEDGTPTFTSDYKEVFFTRCERQENGRKKAVL